MRDLIAHLLLLAYVATCGVGCGESGTSNVPGCPIPEPANLNAQAIALGDYRALSAPVTSASPHPTTVWVAGAIVDYSARPIHPSVRLTRSVLRPGQFNTPAQRVLEEVMLTRCEDDPAVPAATYGVPPGWQVVATIGMVVTGTRQRQAVDQNGNTVTTTDSLFARGITDPLRRTIWVQADDDAVTPEGSPLMRVLAHEARHAWVYELALRRGATVAEALRESKAVDPAACSAASCGAAAPAP